MPNDLPGTFQQTDKKVTMRLAVVAEVLGYWSVSALIMNPLDLMKPLVKLLQQNMTRMATHAYLTTETTENLMECQDIEINLNKFSPP